MKCVICSNPLKRGQRKFCSDTCYRFECSERQRRNYRKISPLPDKRPCVFCNTIFQPRGEAHICCNKYCRMVLENRKRRDAPKNPRKKKEPRFWEYRIAIAEEKIEKLEKPEDQEPKPKKVIHPNIILRPMSTANSNYLEEIKEFEKQGGEIRLLPSQLDGRTPDANLRSIWGWNIETMYGFGYEIGLMEDLMEEMQDAS